MRIEIIHENKEMALPLLALADEPCFIKNYFERGQLFGLYDDELRAVMLVTVENENWLEIQNLAVAEKYQGQGYGSHLVGSFLDTVEHYPHHYKGIRVRTDEFTTHFYEKCGFSAYKRVKNYFPEKYGKPVFDKGRELIDNIYLKVELQ